MRDRILASLLVLAPASALAASPTFYPDRASFEAALSPGFFVDDYADPGYVFIQNDATMSAVLGEVDYQTTGFSNLNIVQGNQTYCAGCNGSFQLSFQTTSYSGVVGSGVAGFGVDITGHDLSTPYYAYVTYGDGTTDNIALPGAPTFFGLTETTVSVVSVHFGLSYAGTTTNGSFVIDNTTVGAVYAGPDTDGDGIPDASDPCVYDVANDADGDGHCASEGDCDDNDATTYPGAPDICDGIDNDCDASGGLVGSFNVHDGPAWATNPPVYNCLEACALLFGGADTDYQCSTSNTVIDNLAYLSGYADSQYCYSPAPEDFSVGTYYDCGVFGCSYSAYVNDNCFGAPDTFCWGSGGPGFIDEDAVDTDGDGTCDALDPCALDPDDDIDGDGLCGDVDICPTDPGNDADNDLWCTVDGDCDDNNPTVYPGALDVCDGIDNDCDATPALVGSFAISDGPAWQSNPPVYSCLDACALIYGGAAGDYECSTSGSYVDNQAYVDGWDDTTYCYTPVAEDFSLGTYYDCGATGCSYSAYVQDHYCAAVNYCWAASAGGIDEDAVDTDSDGTCDVFDNCPADPNPNQYDTDGDGIGDVCDLGGTGTGTGATGTGTGMATGTGTGATGTGTGMATGTGTGATGTGTGATGTGTGATGTGTGATGTGTGATGTGTGATGTGTGATGTGTGMATGTGTGVATGTGTGAATGTGTGDPGTATGGATGTGTGTDTAEEDPKGCGCATGSAPGTGWSFGLLALLGLIGRRRQG